VPTTDPTVTVDTYKFVKAAFDKQATAVADVHDEVLHTATDSAVDAERSKLPKPSPDTVPELPPLSAPLRIP
jgi:hypothetical protein